jgi:subtilisin family serine protease
MDLPAQSARSTAATTTASLPLQIVTCSEDVDLDALILDFKLVPKFIYRGLHGFAAPMDAATIEKLKVHPSVLYVEADGPVTWNEQITPAGLERMGVPNFPVARVNQVNEPLDVDVAILDTGIDPHEDLNVVQSMSPFSGDGNDEVGHGTAVAGILGAYDNGLGVVGVAAGARIWNIKASGPPPNNSWANLLGGMAYVLKNSNQISVASCSLVNAIGNNTGPVNSLRGSVRRLVAAGIVVVGAVGNDSQDLAGVDGVFGTGDDAVPAALAEVMAVSAMDASIYSEGGQPLDQLWSGSNFSQIERTNRPTGSTAANYVVSPGGAIDVTAPGVLVATTLPGVGPDGIGRSYGYKSGTSFAAPHVAGLVALYIAANGRATNADGVYRIRQAIIDSALPQSQWHTNSTLDPDTRPEPLAMASESWVPGPVLTNSGTPGSFQLGFNAVPGYDYAVQVATNLTPPIVWKDLSTIAGSNFVAVASIVDTNEISQSFYRLARRSLVGSLQIIVPPRSRTNVVGTIASLSVTVSGDTPEYRWLKDGTPMTDGGKVSGAGTSALILTGVQSTDAGNYSVVVTNLHGSVTSAPVALTVQSVVLVTGVLATATSELTSHGRNASNAVNGIYYDSNFWQSVGVNGVPPTDPSPAISFDLGTVRLVEKFQIWNGHELAPSVKRMRVEVSMDGISFSPAGEFTLTTISPASETVALGRVACRHVRFVILENGDGQLFPVVGSPTAGSQVAIDEVEFHEYLSD